MAEEGPAPAKPQLFEQTSQYRHWRFTSSALAELRAANNARGAERVLRGLREEAQVGAAGDLETRIAEATNNLLTPDEELQLVGYYLQMIVTTIQAYARVYRANNLLRPEALNNVKATAINFMKRFYLHNVVFDYPPKSIMLTCVYLATKVENSFMKIDDFIRPLQEASAKRGVGTTTKSEDILGLEFVVIQSLQFELAVHHPFRAAYGLFLDMQEYIDDAALLKAAYERVNHYIEPSLLTDLVYLYQPAQIALGAFRLAAKEKDLDIDPYLVRRFEPHDLEVLYPILDEIQDTIAGFKPVPKERAQAIDRKLILCRNPEKNPAAALYKKKAADQADVPYVSDSDSE
ncbi:hypothetical protein IWQ57_003914 [Coemansia nantahalensis]|uniref:Uncharacterized protein n=2 Tax=Coemansia TaxID=4863 RepID=A0ACC1KVJ8_9FUNG|nr:hypothetical protein IWQ57_003914 [Coemansia nantahalensis]KAJ2796093.1 hypothetical protein H4R21_004850 [Coemansia helicoidea]